MVLNHEPMNHDGAHADPTLLAEQRSCLMFAMHLERLPLASIPRARVVLDTTEWRQGDHCNR